MGIPTPGPGFDRERLATALGAAESTKFATLKSALIAFAWNSANQATYDAAVLAADKAYQKSVLLARLLFGGEQLVIGRALYVSLNLASDTNFGNVQIG